MEESDILVFSFQYLLNPRISDLVTKVLPPNAIVIFDEAHNIDNVCMEVMSVSLDRPLLDTATFGVKKLLTEIDRAKLKGSSRLESEYRQLVCGGGGSREMWSL